MTGFTSHYQKHTKFLFIDAMNPLTLSNNFLLPFLVSILKDYFKSTFVALLRYSQRKSSFFKNARLTSSQLISISDGTLLVEEAVAEYLPFQSIKKICQHFKVLDPKLDLSGTLIKPYNRRKKLCSTA